MSPATDAILDAAGATRPGEWTTYGEISMVAFGHRGGARAVGRVAARDPRFPNAHRVIAHHGRVPAGWGGGGSGPDICRARLEAEGVVFRGGAADPGRRLRWQALVARLRSS